MVSREHVEDRRSMSKFCVTNLVHPVFVGEIQHVLPRLEHKHDQKLKIASFVYLKENNLEDWFYLPNKDVKAVRREQCIFAARNKLEKEQEKRNK